MRTLIALNTVTLELFVHTDTVQTPNCVNKAHSEESADLLSDWIQVDVVETGSGWQTGHGAHLRETPHKQFYLKKTNLCFFLQL